MSVAVLPPCIRQYWCFGKDTVAAQTLPSVSCFKFFGFSDTEEEVKHICVSVALNLAGVGGVEGRGV